jgi:hypothetical protein
MTDKILCSCVNCLKETNGQGKLITRKTHSIHMKIEKEYSDPDQLSLVAFIPDNVPISGFQSKLKKISSGFQSKPKKIPTEVRKSTDSLEPMEIEVSEQSAESPKQQHLPADDPVDSGEMSYDISPELSEEGSENVPEDDPIDSDDGNDISPELLELLEGGSEDEFNMMEGGSEEEFSLPEEREYPSDLGNFDSIFLFSYLFLKIFLIKSFVPIFTQNYLKR